MAMSSHAHPPHSAASAAKLAAKVGLPPSLARRYALLRELGQGAYGLVWCVAGSNRGSGSAADRTSGSTPALLITFWRFTISEPISNTTLFMFHY